MSLDGRILGGRYRLLQPLGKGGMGTVWTAQHIELDSRVAVKLIDEQVVESTSVRERFRLEAKLAANLNSDHVVRMLDYGVDSGTPYIVMELLDGESLDRRLERVGRLSAAELANLLSQVALALDRAHARGLIHRDLKPANLFLARTDDGRECVKLLDFGTAKSLRGEDVSLSQTRTGTLVGSPAYMSPEQLRGARDIDASSDLWSLGVVAYECLVGQRPFEGRTIADLTIRICAEPLPIPSEHAPVPDGFDAWFARACAREPRARLRSAHDLVASFEALIPERVPGVTESQVRAPARGPTKTLLGGVGSAVVRRAITTRDGRSAQIRGQAVSETAHQESTAAMSRTQPGRAAPRVQRIGWFLIGAGTVAFALFAVAVGATREKETDALLQANASSSGSSGAHPDPPPAGSERVQMEPVDRAAHDLHTVDQPQTGEPVRRDTDALRSESRRVTSPSRSEPQRASPPRAEPRRRTSKAPSEVGTTKKPLTGPDEAPKERANRSLTRPGLDASSTPDFGF